MAASVQPLTHLPARGEQRLRAMRRKMSVRFVRSLCLGFILQASTLELEWMWPIVLRNLVATWVICGGWDFFLYFSPFAPRLRPYKLNQKLPSAAQLKHDACWTTVSSICAALLEIGLCHGWATGALPMERSLATSPWWNAVAVLTITHWRIPHFYVIHRGMHPWKCTGFPDVGKFLYRHVHSLHHKSYNPTAFSGTSMHPVESTLYYSACLMAVPFGAHPAIVLGCIVDCGVGAWLGHDGFQWPGSGDYFHQASVYKGWRPPMPPPAVAALAAAALAAAALTAPLTDVVTETTGDAANDATSGGAKRRFGCHVCATATLTATLMTKRH